MLYCPEKTGYVGKNDNIISSLQLHQTYQNGDWFLYLKNEGDKPATLVNFKVTFYGTEEDPQPDTKSYDRFFSDIWSVFGLSQ